MNGGKRLKHLASPIKNADACGTIEFMACEYVEVCPQISDVDVEMNGALRAVHQDGDAALMGEPDHLLDRRRRSQDIRHLRDSDDPGSLIQGPLKRVDREGTIIANVDPPQYGPLAFAMEMPRHNVGVMLHYAERNFVARTNVAQTKARRDKVDRLRCRSRKDDLFGRAGIQEPPYCLTRGFVGFRRRICQKV